MFSTRIEGYDRVIEATFRQAMYIRCIFSLMLLALISSSNFAADTATYGIKYNGTDQKNEVWRANDDGSETLLIQFAFPSGGWQTGKSFADDKTGKLFLWDSGAGLSELEKGFVVYDPATNSITTGVKEGYQEGYQATFQSVLKIDDLIRNDVNTSGSPISVIGSNDIVGADGDTLISKESDGSVHIGENSLVTVEEAGVQQLYATDANGDSIDINIKEGTDLLLNGASVSNSLDDITTNATNISTNTAGIATNAAAIVNLRSSYSSAIASTVAMGQIDIADEGFSIGIGAGNFNGENAMGIGLGYGGQFENGSRFKLRASKSGGANGAGISISF